MGATSGNRVSAADVFVVWHAHEQANLTLGQFKAPFGREFLLPDTGTVSLERSPVSDQLVAGGQLGAMLSGGDSGGRVTYVAGVFNGNGGNTSTNDNDRFLCAGRLTALVAQTATASLAVGANPYTSDDTRLWTLGFNYLLKGQDLRFSVNYLFGETAGATQDRLLIRTQVVF